MSTFIPQAKSANY